MKLPQMLSYRETGQGAPVVLLHGSASSGRQWRSLSGCLEGRFRVITPDLPGYGGSPSLGDASMEEILARLAPVLRRVGSPVHLVGHSFGGAVALSAAMQMPELVQTLVLIEPTSFNFAKPSGQTLDVMALKHSMAVLLAEGDAWSAMQKFVEFWNGMGAWERTSLVLRQRLAASAAQILRDFEAIAGDQAKGADLAGVFCPTLAISGQESPKVSRQLLDRICRQLPFAERIDIAGAGHMAPLTDPHITDPAIRKFLEKADAGCQGYAGKVDAAA